MCLSLQEANPQSEVQAASSHAFSHHQEARQIQDFLLCGTYLAILELFDKSQAEPDIISASEEIPDMASYLDAFTVRVRKRAAKQANKLGNFDGSSGDLLALLDRFISRLDITTSHDQKYRGILTIDGHSIDQHQRTITGRILAGHHGRISRFIDIRTSEEAFSRKLHHAEAQTFYFKMFIPHDEDKGIILLQRIGSSSPFTAFKYFFLDYFRSAYRGFVAEVNSLVNREELDALLRKGVAEKIRITDFNLYRRVEDIRDSGNHQEVSASLVISQRAHEQRNLMRDIVSSLAETRKTGIAELDEHIDIGSKIKISIEDNEGRKHTIDLNSPKVRLSTEVAEPPEAMQEAYRSYLEAEAQKFMGHIAARLWGEQADVWQHQSD